MVRHQMFSARVLGSDGYMLTVSIAFFVSFSEKSGGIFLDFGIHTVSPHSSFHSSLTLLTQFRSMLAAISWMSNQASLTLGSK